jgi:hypothetical protein
MKDLEGFFRHDPKTKGVKLDTANPPPKLVKSKEHKHGVQLEKTNPPAMRRKRKSIDS